MRILRSILIGTLLGLLLSCAMMFREVRPVPNYKGVDQEAAPYVNEWLELAKLNGITFYNTVTVGFSNIERSEVIGECNYSYFFREIDLDQTYWKTFTKIRKTALLYHELTHCYCGRKHDYAVGKEYDNNERPWFPLKREGFFLDGCPLSLMYPYVVEDSCFISHYAEYTKEMFNRCEPF